LNWGSPAHETGVLTRLNYSAAILKRTEFYFKKLSIIVVIL